MTHTPETIQFSRNDREAIDKAIRSVTGSFITGLDDQDRLDMIEGDDAIMEEAIKFGLELK